METLVLIIHVIIAIVLVVMILLQQGKGADAGASFGSGASQTVFGGRGSTGFLVKLTAVMAACLLATSLTLDLLTKHKVKRESDGNISLPAVTEQKSSTKPASDAPTIKQSTKQPAPLVKGPAKATHQGESPAKKAAAEQSPADKSSSKNTKQEGATGNLATKPAKEKVAQQVKKAPSEKTATSNSAVNKKTTETAKKESAATKQNDHPEHNSIAEQKKQP